MKLETATLINIYALLAASTWALPLKSILKIDLYKVLSITLLALSISIVLVHIILKPYASSAVKKAALVNLATFVGFLMIGFLSGALQSDVLSASLGMVEYCVFLLPLLLLNLAGFPLAEHSSRIIRLNTIFAIAVGLIGVYQYFFDNLLGGMYTGSEMEHLDLWSVKRIPSVMGSIQVYAAYMSFSVLAIYTYHPFGVVANRLLIVVLLALGAFSGGQTFFALAAMQVFLMIIDARSALTIVKNIIIAVVSVSVLILVLSNWVSVLDPLMRIVGVFDSGAVGTAMIQLNQVRFDIWSNAIFNTPLLSGNGFGAASLLVHGSDRFNTESYLVSVYYEVGIMGLLLMTQLLISLVLQMRRTIGFARAMAVLTCVLLYAISVHVYYSVFLFVVWLVVFMGQSNIMAKQKELR